MKKVTQIEVGGEIHNVVDSEGRLLLHNEVQRAKMAEDKIKADLQKVEEITEIGTKKLNSLLGDGEDSISGQIEKEISEVLQTSTDVFEKIEQISDWFEEDTTGSAALVDKVTNLENTKADKNGRYPDLSVGFSDNLVGRNETKESDFIFQPTANDWSVEDGAARIERIKGNTLVWNQLIDKDKYTTSYHSKITKDGDAIIVTTMTEEDDIVYDDGNYDPYIDYYLNSHWITDHKYYFSIQGSVLDDEKQSSFPVEGQYPEVLIITQIYGAKEGTPDKIWRYADHSNLGSAGGSWKRWEIIVTGDASQTFKLFRVKSQAPGVRFKYKEPLCIDLTRMFGAGNEPTTVAEFRAMFPEINPEKVEGRLVDFKGGKLETDGFNQLCLSECVEFKYDKNYDPQEPHPFKEGTWWNGIGVNGYVRSRHKYTDVKIGNNSLSAISNGGHTSAYGIGFPVRVIPGEKYYLNFNSPLGNTQTVKIGLFDIEGKYINEDTQYNHTFTANPGAYWALIIFIPNGTDSTVKLPMEFTDINLNLYHSGYRNGEVELGGEKDDITIDLSSIKDKEGNLVFPDGCLRSAGNIYDEIIGNKVIRRVGVIENLGVLDWKKYSTGNGKYRFIAKAITELSNSVLNLPTLKPNIAVSAGFNITSAEKTFEPTVEYSIFGEAERYLYLFSLNYQSYTVERLKEEVLSGVKMYYELVKPEVYELPEPLPLDYRVWDFGTEHFTPELGGSGLKADISYGFNAVDQIRANRDNIENILGVVGENGAAELNAKIDNIKDTLGEQKADKDGFYPTLTTGFSENLIGRGEAVEAEFTFRPSGGEQSIEDGVARIEKIKGNTIVWNQLAKKYRSMSNSVFVDYNESTDIYTIKANPEHTNNTIQLSIDCYRSSGMSWSIIKNHKYYISFYLADVITINNSVYDFYISNIDASSRPSIGFNHYIKTYNKEDRGNWYFNILKKDFSENPWTGEEEYKLLGFPITIDLTLMFGAGNEPQTPEEFTAMFPNLSFSGHIPGELKSLSFDGIKTVGFNALNLDRVKGTPKESDFDKNTKRPSLTDESIYVVGLAGNNYFSPGQVGSCVVENGAIVIKSTAGYGVGFAVKTIPNTTYWLQYKASGDPAAIAISQYDATGANLTYYELYSSGSFKTKAQTAFCVIIFKSNGLDKEAMFESINLNISHTGYRNGEVENYESFTRQLPKIKEIFPGGLKQVGDVYDEITETQAIKRIGVVEDLSTLSWSFNKQGYFYSSELSDIIANSEKTVIPNILCPKFTTVSWDTLYDCKINYSCSSITSSINVGVSSIGIYFDSSVTTVDALLPRIKNTPLYYELKNPEITTFSEPLNLSYKVWDFGTEEILGNEIPIKADIVYGFNAVDTIRGNKLAIESLKENIPGLDNKIEAEDTDIVVESIEENLVTGALRKTAQVLTDAEKQQVQKNIGVDGLSNAITSERERAMEVEEKLNNSLLTQGTVRFDRIVEEEITINTGTTVSIQEIVYSKHYNKFVAADSTGSYWDTWQGMEACMSGGKIRENKVYLYNGISYIYDNSALFPTSDTLTDSAGVNNIIKELYSDIDYRKVNRIRIVCAFPANNRFYNGIYLYGEEGTLAAFESSYDNENTAVDSFKGFLSNKEMAVIVSTADKPFTINRYAKFLRPINIPLAVSKSLVKDAIIGSAIKELFIDNSIGIEIPPLVIKNLRRNYQGAYSGEYGMLLTDGAGTTYFGFGTTDDSKVVNRVIQLDDIKGTGAKAYAVIDWSALEENKPYDSGAKDFISDAVFNITLQPTINSYLKYAEKSDMIEVAEIVAENTDKIEKKLDATLIKSKNLFDKNAIIYGQAISFSTTNDTIISIDTKWETGATSDFIPVEPLETYYLYRGYNGSNEVFTFVAADKMTLLRPIDPDTDTELSVEECRNKNRAYKAPANAAYAIFTIALSNATAEKASLFQFEVGSEYTGYVDFYQRYVADYLNLPIELEYRHNYPDKLWRKKYVACGDSFTAGDFTGDTTGDYIFTEGKFAGKKKVYPYFIGMRNNMEVINEAISGSIMALDKTYVADPENIDINTRRPFSYERYKKIPADADYITLWFGINDSANTNLGTIDDATNETFYGAWNVVMEYLITNHPYAKIGIIITNGGKAEYREAEREIARKWGIPFLDMMGDEQVPPIFGRETSLGLSSVANTLRRNSFRVSSSNGHPNQYAHEYESTFIEEFLRRL